jgi:hypothetical protein
MEGMGNIGRRLTRSTIWLAGVVSLALFALAPRADAAAVQAPGCIAGETTVPITADAKALAAHPNRHYGRSGSWKVNYAAKAVSFVTFDLPALPLQCTVTKATIDLKGTYSGTPDPPNSWPGANVDASLAQRPWTEGRINWNNKPGGNACDEGSLDYARPDSWQITATVQLAYQCLDSGRLSTWNGVKLKGWSPRGRGADWQVVVDSRESSHPPVVEIAWE